MASTEYKIRAALAGSMLEHVRNMPAQDRDAILKLVPEDVVETVANTIPLAWIPMATHMALVDPVRDVVGSKRNVELWHATVLAYYQRPLLRGVTSMATRLFGMKPRALVKLLPRAYAVSTRNLGEVVTIEEHDVVFTELRGFPASQFRFSNYVQGMLGSTTAALSATFSALELPVSIDEVVEDEGYVRYRIDTRGL